MTTVLKRNKWEIWRDVIFALFAREIRVGFNDKFGISWAVVQPVVFIFVLAFIRGRLDSGETHTIPTFIFIAFGMILIQSFLQTLSAGASAIKKNRALFAFRQVQPLSAVIAAGMFEFIVKLFVVMGIALILYFIGMEMKLADPLSIILYFVSLWLFALSVGLLFGLAALYIPEVEKVQTLMTRPMFFISGVFFSLKDFPEEYWYLLNWNPILHAIELARFSAYPSYGLDGVSVSYLLISTLVALFLALVCYQGFWKQAISR
ncbi:ABC transporter permease [Lacimicrobium alkaliphilum]|uniref:Transport permease protein n=1 Tax=Lacimicrobium alkaliphilum TaxID=1526571 RepID=A0ABQ1R4C7_9ALTE|nr:ABC transporter permease [Lacimicrobium alkaliphilum]GGD57728.1 sugar ABC transporter permease [Lacimicrobium alkaliphilum]